MWVSFDTTTTGSDGSPRSTCLLLGLYCYPQMTRRLTIPPWGVPTEVNRAADLDLVAPRIEDVDGLRCDSSRLPFDVPCSVHRFCQGGRLRRREIRDLHDERPVHLLRPCPAAWP